MDTRKMIAVVAALVTWGSAPSVADTIAIESYVGRRPVTADALLQPVFEELEARGFRSRSSLARAIEDRASRSGAASDPQFNAELNAGVSDGFNAWLRGEFDRAIAILTPVVARVHAQPAMMADNQDARLKVRQALVGLSLAHQRKGNVDQAEKFMAELIRSFPDAEVSRATFGPEARTLFDRVRDALRDQGRGRLVIEVDEPTAVIFINERFEAVGRAEKSDLLPGTYRIYVQRAKVRGRVYSATVQPGTEVKIAVDWGFDAALRTEPWVGFEFDTVEAQTTHESEYAARLARLVGASAVAEIGIVNVRGKPAVVGSVLSLETKRPLRSASLALDPDPPPEKLRALAAFLAGEDAGEGLVVLEGSASAPAPRPRDRAEVPTGGPGPLFWATAVGSVAGLVTGGILIGLDGRCATDAPAGGGACADVYDTKLAGLVSLGAGVALGGAATYLWLRSRGPKRAAPISAIVTPHRIHITAAWQF